MLSRNSHNLLSNQRTGLVTLENRQTISLDKTSLIFPKISNSSVDKKSHTIETDFQKEQKFSNNRPLSNIGFKENYLDKTFKEYKSEKGKNDFSRFETLDDELLMNKSYVYPSSTKNSTPAKNKPIDSLTLWKESKNILIKNFINVALNFNLKGTIGNSNSLCLSNLLTRNCPYKNNLINNLKSNLSLDKLINKTRQDRNQSISLHTVNSEITPTSIKKDKASEKTEKKMTSLGDFLKLTPSSEIKLNQSKIFY
jgi:hypothetical protein